MTKAKRKTYYWSQLYWIVCILFLVVYLSRAALSHDGFLKLRKMRLEVQSRKYRIAAIGHKNAHISKTIYGYPMIQSSSGSMPESATLAWRMKSSSCCGGTNPRKSIRRKGAKVRRWRICTEGWETAFGRCLLCQTLVLAAVADGVSSCPCDWLATGTACSVISTSFEELSGTIADRIQQRIFKANEAILNTTGECAGMRTTLAMIAWHTNENILHYASIGDSRIYLFGPHFSGLLKKDDTAIL
jgi:hypothetical protein